MAKQLIVSVNGREKKIAIIEDDKVAEFYIERGEQHQGIVGNIYKGRVMRVLPGMQSAFVDIGLERDAFLYVSDFFDEEEEFERIVMDKSKKATPDEAARAAQERIEQGRIEREHHIEATQERAEPLLDAESAVISEAEQPEAPEIITVEASTQAVAAAAEQQQPSREAEGGGRKRGRRGRRRGKSDDEKSSESSAGQGVGSTSAFDAEDIATPFVADAGSFERV